MANCSTSGTFPPRALRSVAILLMFTLNRVIQKQFLYVSRMFARAWRTTHKISHKVTKKK
jgi:hypothetical protein